MTATTGEQSAPADLFAEPTGRATVRVGVIGAAGDAVPHLRALTASVPAASVVALCDDGAPQRVAELATYAGARVARTRGELLAANDLDAVVVAGPDPVPVLLSCLEAGLPTYLVPGRAPDPDDARAVASLEEALGRRLVQVGFVRRHDPSHLALRRAVARLGDVVRLRAVERGGGAASTLHAMDTLAWLLGRPVTSVRRDADGGLHGPSLLTARCADPAGSVPTVTARVETFDRAGWGHELGCDVVGSDDAASLPPVPVVGVRREGSAVSALPAGPTARFADAYRTSLLAWLHGLRTGRPSGAGTWDWYVAAAVAASATASLGRETEIDAGPRPALWDGVGHRAAAQAPLVPRGSSDEPSAESEPDAS